MSAERFIVCHPDDFSVTHANEWRTDFDLGPFAPIVLDPLVNPGTVASVSLEELRALVEDREQPPLVEWMDRVCEGITR